jgi:hypothetical protein
MGIFSFLVFSVLIYKSLSQQSASSTILPKNNINPSTQITTTNTTMKCYTNVLTTNMQASTIPNLSGIENPVFVSSV